MKKNMLFSFLRLAQLTLYGYLLFPPSPEPFLYFLMLDPTLLGSLLYLEEIIPHIFISLAHTL